MRRRDAIGLLLNAVGFSAAVRVLFPGGRLRILAYHRVLDVPAAGDFPFDLELVSASTSAFRQQMAHLRAHWHPISLSAALDCIDAGRALPRRAVVVTFDDGFSDNYTNAYPILQEFAIPACIFVSTGFIDTQQTFWFDRLTQAILTTRKRSMNVPWQSGLTIPAGDQARRALLAGILRRLKTMENTQRLTLLRSADEQLECPPAEQPHELSAPLTWAQITEMASHGIEFGSHTVTHPILTMLDLKDVEAELTESRARLESQLGRSIDLLAYPVGGRHAFNAAIIAIAQRAGYRAACSYVSGANSLRALQRYALRRIPVERYVSFGQFRSGLALPGLFA